MYIKIPERVEGQAYGSLEIIAETDEEEGSIVNCIPGEGWKLHIRRLDRCRYLLGAIPTKAENAKIPEGTLPPEMMKLKGAKLRGALMTEVAKRGGSPEKTDDVPMLIMKLRKLKDAATTAA